MISLDVLTKVTNPNLKVAELFINQFLVDSQPAEDLWPALFALYGSDKSGFRPAERSLFDVAEAHACPLLVPK